MLQYTYVNYFSIYIYIAYIEFELLLVEIHSSNLYLMNQEYSSENLDVIKPGKYSLNFLKPNLIKNVQSMYLLQKKFRLSSTNYMGTELGNTVPVNCKMI